MSKTPPNRRGITFEVGAQLEARDSLKNWYAANIEKIDYEDEKVLIHYRQWSHRYDEWFDWASPYLRPVERIQLRREGLQDDCPIPGFHVNDKVLASWSDCRFYPAKVIAVNKDASYTVKFYDGVIQTVKGIHVKPFIKERKGGKPRSTDRNKDKPLERRVAGGRGSKLVENGSTRNRKGRHSGSDQDGESDSEEDEGEEEEEEDKDLVEGLEEAQHSSEDGIGKRERTMRRKTSEEGMKEQPKKRTMERRKTAERSQKQELGLEITIPARDDGDDLERREGGEKGEFGLTGSGQHTEEPGESVTQREELNGSGGPEEGEEARSREEMKMEDEEEREHGTDHSSAEQHHPQGRRTRNRLTTARWVDNTDHGVLELRKRRISLGQSTPSKRCKVDTSADKDSPAESKPASTEPTSKRSTEPQPDTAPVPSGAADNTEEEPSVQGQPECPGSTGEGVASAPPVKAPVRRQANNPNRFSREPLYRVVKNQPPPVLFVNLDHNPFKCQVPGCLKSFRKAKLLHYHMKYYHSGDKAPEADLSPSRSVQTRASDKQGTSPDSPKRRRTISASMHSSLHSPHRAPQSPGKAGSKLVERRRTSAPPAVHMQNLPRSLLREKSRENHLEKGGRRPQERAALDMVLAKEREKQREKKRDFLRIKLKKKKKKKKKPKSAYAGSEENIDISVFGLPPKLNLSHKLPPSHKHKFESYSCSPGQYSTELIRVEDDASGSDWSSDSLGWSEDETEAELDVTTPPQELSMHIGTGGSEIVRCVCEVEEENDFMVQCEECLCWQHGACMGLLDDNVPGRYTCYICRDPPGQRQSQRYWYDRDWLSRGHMYGLPFLEENYSHQNAKKIAATHQLLGDVHRVVEVLNGLQLKMSVLQSQTGPDLKLWCQPWKQAEKLSRKGVAGGMAVLPHSVEDNEERGGRARGVPGADASPPPQQASYISSEHCYQKPRTYYPAVEQRLVVETRGLAGGAGGNSDLEHSLRSTEDLLALERRYGGPLDPERGRGRATAQLDLPGHTKEADGCRWRPAGQVCEVKVEETGGGAGDGGGGACLQQQWQANLLDHIEAVQEEVTHRMDFIEKELDVLESWLDYTGELEPPEPLARLPQLKHRIKQLLCELAKLQQIAHCCAT